MGLGWFLTGAIFSVFVAPVVLGNPESSFKIVRDVFQNLVQIVEALQ